MSDQPDPNIRPTTPRLPDTAKLEEFFQRIQSNPDKTSATVPPTNANLQTITDDDMQMPVSSDEDTVPNDPKLIPTLPNVHDPNLTLAPFNILSDSEGCPYCQATRYADSIFCHRCGRPLLPRDQIDTCRHCKTPLVPSAHFCYICGKRAVSAPELTLSLVDTPQQYTLRGDQLTYTVGRQVPEQSNFVDIDLGDIGQRKISRQHARLTLHEKVWYLEDLGSKAGTRIYNTRLLPNQPAILQTGMIIYFADLKFKVDIQEA